MPWNPTNQSTNQPSIGLIAKSAVAEEYTEYTSAEGWDPSNECPGYDTK